MEHLPLAPTGGDLKVGFYLPFLHLSPYLLKKHLAFISLYLHLTSLSPINSLGTIKGTKNFRHWE